VEKRLRRTWGRGAAVVGFVEGVGDRECECELVEGMIVLL
jgi:hypothetical protein